MGMGRTDNAPLCDLAFSSETSVASASSPNEWHRQSRTNLSGDVVAPHADFGFRLLEPATVGARHASPMQHDSGAAVVKDGT